MDRGQAPEAALTPQLVSSAAWLVAITSAAVAVSPRSTTHRRRVTFAAIAVALSCIPVAGWSLVRWLVGLGAVPSASSVILLTVAAWERLTGGVVFGARDWRAAFRFYGAAALLLYPMALGLVRFDPYALGWGTIWMPITLWAFSLGLMWSRNRFALVLAAAVLAFDLRLLESTNLRDYLIDPPLATMSLLMLATILLRRLRGLWARPVPSPDVAGQV